MFGLVQQVWAAKDVPVKAQLPSFLAAVTNLSFVLGWVIKLIFVFAALFVFYHLVMGALKWILSAGEKEKVEKARQEITTAVVGFVILVLVFGLIVLIETIFDFGLGISRQICIPKFSESAPIDCPA